MSDNKLITVIVLVFAATVDVWVISIGRGDLFTCFMLTFEVGWLLWICLDPKGEGRDE